MQCRADHSTNSNSVELYFLSIHPGKLFSFAEMFGAHFTFQFSSNTAVCRNDSQFHCGTSTRASHQAQLEREIFYPSTASHVFFILTGICWMWKKSDGIKSGRRKINKIIFVSVSDGLLLQLRSQNHRSRWQKQKKLQEGGRDRR